MSDLELPPGFGLARAVFAHVSADDVRRAIDWRQEYVTAYGRKWEVPRLTAWYGTERYTYSKIVHEPRPMPALVADIHGQLTGRGTFVDASTCLFNSVLANLYRHGGESVAWHADDEPELGEDPTIASVSLGASRTFAIKRRADGRRWDIVLAHGDLLVMGGASQRDYLHSVPKTAKVIGPRVNLTFRQVWPAR